MYMKKILFILLFAGIGLSVFSDLSNVTSQWCENDTGVWRCHLDALVNDASGKFNGDIGCFSLQSTVVDRGCFAEIILQSDTQTSDCTYSVQDNEIVYNPCESVTLNKGNDILVTIDSVDLDLSKCDKFQEGAVYVNQCKFDGTDVKFSGVVSLENKSSPIIFITAMTLPTGDFWSFITNNLVYIILIIIIIVIAYWIFAPRKLMLKEKKAVQKEQALTKRESRYGRKL